MKNNHWIWMVLGCVLPLLFIFLAPTLGIGSGSSLFLFILFMFACHLFMPHVFMPHGSHRHDNHSLHNQEEPQKKNQTTLVESKEELKKNHKH